MNTPKVDFSTDEELFTSGMSHDETRGALTLKKNFLPWHKPRKQWIRTHQWNKSISQLASELKLAEAQRPLDYLCLPGQDLLDIRELSPLCNQLGIDLRFLGLNYINPKKRDAAQKRLEQATSLSEVHGLPRVHAASEVLPEMFESISSKSSVTYEKIINSRGTFDVINIDLCRSFGEGHPSDTNETLYNALFHLFHKQAEQRTEDWLFFLTTRNTTGMVHDEVWDRLIAIINARIENDETFAPLLISRGIISKNCISEGKVSKELLSRGCYVGVFGVAVGFWIVNCLADANPGWKAEMQPSFGYHVFLRDDDPACDMISLAFKCSKIPRLAQDRYGLANTQLGVDDSPMASRTACEKNVVQQHADQVDVDLMLYKDEGSFTTALTKSIDLLSSARYDIDSYKKFVDESMSELEHYLRGSGLLIT